MLNCRSGFHPNYEDPKVSNLERSKVVSEIRIFMRSVSCAHCWLFLHSCETAINKSDYLDNILVEQFLNQCRNCCMHFSCSKDVSLTDIPKPLRVTVRVATTHSS